MALSRLNLEEALNKGCRKRCNQRDRETTTENDLCVGVNSIQDNLPIRCVGEWAAQKIYFLLQYFGIFSTAMKNKFELNYIEICSGPGRCISRENGIEFNGTALGILKHPAYNNINKALFFDFNKTIVDTLKSRIESLNKKNAKVFFGDYLKPEDICYLINNEISRNSLNLVFIDPTDCSVPFSLINSLKETIPRFDLIINVATGSDYNRNIKETLLNQEKYSNNVTKYAFFLNSSNFFQDPDNLNLAKTNNHLGLRNKFRDEYINSLKSLGYTFFQYQRIKNLYDILFATEHKLGLTFWEKANKYKYDGQQSLF